MSQAGDDAATAFSPRPSNLFQKRFAVQEEHAAAMDQGT
jgi:hypothetical protein